MICSFSSLRNKEIVNIKTGLKIGYADDIELDTSNSNVVSIIVYGRMGRDEDIVIKCSNISLIGEDTILVNFDDAKCTKNISCKIDDLLK